MNESVERKYTLPLSESKDVRLLSGVRSRDLSEAERRQVAKLVPKLFALIAVTFSAALAASWWLGPGAVPAAVASTTIAVGAWVDGLIAAGLITKAVGVVLMGFAVWGIRRKAGARKSHGDPL